MHAQKIDYVKRFAVRLYQLVALTHSLQWLAAHPRSQAVHEQHAHLLKICRHTKSLGLFQFFNSPDNVYM